MKPRPNPEKMAVVNGEGETIRPSPRISNTLSINLCYYANNSCPYSKFLNFINFFLFVISCSWNQGSLELMDCVGREIIRDQIDDWEQEN